jgi:hypothetical protein
LPGEARGRCEVTIVGALAQILAFAQKTTAALTGGGGTSLMVAGARNSTPIDCRPLSSPFPPSSRLRVGWEPESTEKNECEGDPVSPGLDARSQSATASSGRQSTTASAR